MAEDKKEGFMDKLKDKIKGEEHKEHESTGGGTSGEHKKHEGFGAKVKEEAHKFHEEGLREEKMEADDNIWGSGPK